MSPFTFARMKVPSRARRRVAMVAIAVLVVVGTLGATPKVANHFGYALPGERGLPYQVHYNGRDYRNYLTCAGARWCEDPRTANEVILHA